MGKVMEELNQCEDWKQVKHPPSLYSILQALELEWGQAYITKAEKQSAINEAIKQFYGPLRKPVKVQIRRAHLRVKPEKAFRHGQVPMNRYDTLEIYGMGQKRTKGEGRAAYYSRLMPGLFHEKALVVSKTTREYLKEHGHKVKRPEGLRQRRRVYKKRASYVISPNPVVMPRPDDREFSVGEGDNQFTVTLRQSERNGFRVFCDILPSFPKTRVYHAKHFVAAIKCYKAWCEQARKDWIASKE